MTIAEDIRSATREELGLTVSIGVSYNKIFAKLGSDMKKPAPLPLANLPHTALLRSANWLLSIRRFSKGCWA